MGEGSMRRVLSFDMDGTLEAGNPPGPVTMDMVRQAQAMGYIIGSASDKPIPVQKMIWDQHNIEVSFAIHKQNLDQVRAQFEADVYQHIGDTNMDEHYALLHGFEYLDVAMDLSEPWMLFEIPVEAAGDGATMDTSAAIEFDQLRTTD